MTRPFLTARRESALSALPELLIDAVALHRAITEKDWDEAEFRTHLILVLSIANELTPVHQVAHTLMAELTVAAEIRTAPIMSLLESLAEAISDACTRPPGFSPTGPTSSH